MRRLRAGLELDQRGDRLPVAAAARQGGDRHTVDAAIAAEYQQRVDAATGKGAVQGVAGLEGKPGRIDLVARHAADPALQADHDRDRFVDDADLGHRLLLGLDQRAALVAMLFGVGLDLADQQALQGSRAAEDLVELLLFVAQFLQFLLDLDCLQPRQLAQPDVEDVVGLPLAQLEARDQRRLRFVGLADDADHLVDVQQHQLPALKHMDPLEHLL